MDEKKLSNEEKVFRQGLPSFVFSSDNGSLSVCGRDLVELREVLELASQCPSVSIFLGLAETSEKKASKGRAVS